ATGATADLRARFPEAELVELNGVVVPGFNDAHLHPSIVAEDLLHHDLFGTRSNRDAEDVVRQAALSTPPGEWIRATRYDDARMAEGRVLTRFELDEVAPDHPVLVVHVAGHWGVANSRALELGGLDDTSQARPGGDLGRDASGHLNGLLVERELFRYAYPAVAGGP